MTPAARLSPAISVLDRVLAGDPAEQVLTNWGRASRFAGSGDRHAVRDLVYDALRCLRSHAALGGAMTGRGLVLGGLRAKGQDPQTLFTGEGHAPAPVTAADAGRKPAGAEALDIQDWIYPHLSRALGEEIDKTLEAMRQRAPVFLRVNVAKADPPKAIEMLAKDGISAHPVSFLSFALEVTENARKIHGSTAYADGVVELQDASPQAVIEALPLQDGQRVLDLYRELQAHEEVPAMLAALKAGGLNTAILSNGSPGMLAGAVASAGIGGVLDDVLSVESVGVFKPHDSVYDLVGARFGCARDEVLFVSSNGWDAAAAAGYGFTTVWVNRAGEPQDRLWAAPGHVLPTLHDIPKLVGV